MMPRIAVGARHAVPQPDVAVLRDGPLPRPVLGELRVAEAEVLVEEVMGNDTAVWR